MLKRFIELLRKFNFVMEIIVSVITLSMFFTVMAADSGEIQISGEYEYKAVKLPTVVYNKSNRGLTDLLVLDEAGEPVPYFVNSFETAVTETSKAILLKLANSYVKKGDYYADYYTETDEGRDLLATSISVKASSGMFAKSVELRGSYDGIVWDYIKTDDIYNVSENKKLYINFDTPLKYTFYRFKLLNNAENVTFDSVTLNYNRNIVNQSFFVERMEADFETIEHDKKTVIKIFGLKNVKIKEMTLETDSRFKRNIYYANKFKEIYNLSFDGNIYKDTTIDFEGVSDFTDALEVEISNGDDKPILIKNITVVYYTDEVIFKGVNDKVYTLRFGDKDIVSAPVYDIDNYRELVLNEGYDLLTVKNIKIDTTEQELAKVDYSAIFNVIVVLVSILLGFIILARLRRSGSAD